MWTNRILLAGLATLSFFSPRPLAAQETLIESVTLIDGTGRPPASGVFVLIRGERITQVRHAPIEVTAAVQRIDGRGKYLIPGLMDLHVHLAGSREPGGPYPEVGIRALHGLLYSGITTIYDPGNDPDYIYGLRDRERSGTIASPRIFTSGAMLSAPGGHGTFKLGIQSWPQDIPKLEAHIARQPDVVKLMFDELGWGTRPTIPKLSRELLETLIEYCNDRGIRTTAQASSETQARQAIFAGIDTLSHPVIQGPVSESFVRLMAAKKIPMVSTIAIGENYSRLAEKPEYLDQPLYRALLEPEEIRRLKTEVRPQYQEQAWTWWMKVMTPIAQETLRRLHEAGGVVALGSDQSNGAATHRELELLVEAGIAPLDVIRIGTLNAAIYLGLENEMGSIEEGKMADLVLLDADPVIDINNTKKVHLVMKEGRIIDRSSLDLPVNR